MRCLVDLYYFHFVAVAGIAIRCGVGGGRLCFFFFVIFLFHFYQKVYML